MNHVKVNCIKKIGENGKNIVKLLWFMYVYKNEKKNNCLYLDNSLKDFLKNESNFLST